MKVIYVVRGSVGEYSSREEWIVKAFEDEADAQIFIADNQALLNKAKIDAEASDDPYFPPDHPIMKSISHLKTPNFEDFWQPDFVDAPRLYLEHVELMPPTEKGADKWPTA